MKLLSFGEIIWDVNEDQYNIGGAPLNFATHVALQGGDAWLASSVGNDKLGTKAMEHIKTTGAVNTEYISVLNNYITGQCVVSLKNGIPSYNILDNVAYDYISLPNVLSQTFDVIAFGTLALRSEQNRAIIENVLSNNRFEQIYTDLNIRKPFYSKESIDFCLKHATIVKISDEELPIISEQLFDGFKNPMEASEQIIKRYPNINLLLITQGEKGSFCYDLSTHKVYTCGAAPATVVSTVGAGDSYGATFLTQYMKTKDIELSMNLAAKVSSFVIEHQEAIPPTTKDFIKSIIDD